MNKKIYIITITAMVLISSIIIISYNNTLNNNKADLDNDIFNNIITETTNDDNTEDTTNTEPEETPSQDTTDDVPDDTIDTGNTIDEAINELDTPPNPSNNNPSTPPNIIPDTSDDTVSNVPIQTDETPSNNSDNIEPTQATVNITINDPDGDTFNWTIQGQFITNTAANSASNGSKSANITTPLPYNTNIIWHVNVTDGYSWTNATYNFTTRASDKLLLILSPQYNDDLEILDAIENYQDAVFNDIGWYSSIHLLTDDENHPDTILNITKNYYQESNENLKAVMLVGEDIRLHFGAEFGGKETPRLFYIATLQKELTDVREGFKVLPTMVFPNGCDTYEVKKDQLIFTFDKFSNRSYEYGDKIRGYNWPVDMLEHQPNRNQYFESVIDPLGNVTWTTNAIMSEKSKLLDGKYRMVLLSGHGSASCVWPSNYNNVPQIVRTFGYLNTHDITTPVLLLSGCYTQGWGSTNTTNKILDLPNPYKGNEFFGHTILTDDNLRLIMGGQGGVCGSNHSISVRANIFENLSLGRTFAESMLNFRAPSSKYIFYGDPTYHYPVSDFHAEITGPYTIPEYKQVVNYSVQFKTYLLNGVEPFSYHWDFGDGTNSTEQNPIHKFSHRGIYNVSFHVTDGNQKSIEETTKVKISNKTIIVSQSFDEETNGWMIDRFNTITDALDNVYDHVKTIIIQPGIYNEISLLITKQLEIIGENKYTTIINITGQVKIEDVENILIKNVTVKNGNGFCIISSNNITISDSIITDNIFGIMISQSKNCTITKNIIEDISNNNNDVIAPIFVTPTGILCVSSDNSSIVQNVIKNNSCGIHLCNSKDNTIYLNNFINNSISISDTTGLNTYNIDTYGNYYSDYIDLYPDAEVNNEYGHDIWSIPYEISGTSFDMHPLVNPFTIDITKHPRPIGYDIHSTNLPVLIGNTCLF